MARSAAEPAAPAAASARGRGRSTRRLVLDTAQGTAWVDLDVVAGTRLLVIGHGAGGSVDSPDLLAVRDRCLAGGISVARVTQPYRVAGRKAPPRPPVLDSAWCEIVAAIAAVRGLRSRRWIYAGRSSGARVACRTATDPACTPGASAVVALAFPVHPPGKPDQTRLPELDAVPVPVLVVQGSADPFGMPPPAPGREILVVAGDHSLKRSATEAGNAVAEWIAGLPAQ